MAHADVDFPVIIIGAGPAGLMAARKLSSNGVRFLLLSRESESPGQDKVCGGFVPQRALDHFGIKSIQNAYDITGVRMKFPGIEMSRIDFDRVVGINATRGDIGISLLNLIQKSGNEIRLKNRVHRINMESDKVILRTTHDECEDKISAHLLIDASGAIPVSSKNSIVRNRLQDHEIGYGVQYQLRLPSMKTNHEVNDFYYGHEFSPGGYAWIFPRGQEVVVGTGGILSRVKEDKKRSFDYIDKLIKDVEPTCSELRDAAVIRQEAAMMPLAGVIKPSYSSRVLLAGDAAAHCSPISGEGIYYSMLGGDFAAETITHALKNRDYSASRLSRYERRWTKSFGSDLKWGLWLQKRFTKGGSSSLGSSFLKSEKNCRVVAEMLVGERSVRSAIASAAPGYLKSKIGL